MKHLLLTTIAAVVMVLFGGVNEVNGDPLTYRVAGGKVSIVSCDKNASGELVIPSTYEGKPVTSIGGSAFYNCSRITSARIPESVTSIGGSAFSGCSRLTSVRIPDSVTSIGSRAFQYCSSLTSVTIGNSVTSIEGWTFDYCGSLTSVRIPESVTSIENKAFAHCSSLTSVKIGNSVTSIGNLAFYDSVSLTSVTIPDSVISIGNRAFEYCGLTSVIIGDSVTSIGSNAFRYCSSLESITFRGNAPTRYTFSGVSDFAKVFIYRGATGFGETFGGLPVVYKTALPTDHLRYKVGGNTVTITDCNEIVSGALEIPLTYDGKPVTSIGDRAFWKCTNLTSVTIPDSVTRIGRSAFNSCSSLTSVTIPDSVTSIENGAFFGCSSLTSVTIPDNVTRIGRSAFNSCSSLTSVTIPDSVTSIENGAFSRCSSLTSITFEGNVPTLGIDVFVGVSDNAKIFINPGATGFGETFGGLPVIILKKLRINTFSNHAAPFNLSFESKSDSTYLIEASHDLKKWGEIGEAQGTGSSVEFTDWREALFQKQYYRVKLVE